MKIYNAVITQSFDGIVKVAIEPFSTFEKAQQYLQNKYEELKNEEIEWEGNISSGHFFIEDSEYHNWWVEGEVKTGEIK